MRRGGTPPPYHSRLDGAHVHESYKDVAPDGAQKSFRPVATKMSPHWAQLCRMLNRSPTARQPYRAPGRILDFGLLEEKSHCGVDEKGSGHVAVARRAAEFRDCGDDGSIG